MPALDTTNNEGVEYKAISGQINVDDAKGIVECFVSGVGNKDSVGDIVLPGAFTESLKRRKPRVVWGHDWNHPIGKVLEIYEVPASDARLPAKMRQAGIGGLFTKVQFNLKSEKGREAFANVAFYGMDQEWSIGYKTLDAIYDNQRQANLLREVELYEVSPVLHGANQLTGTISIKSDRQVVDDALFTSEDDQMYVFEEDEELSIYTDDELVDFFSGRDAKSLSQWFKEDWVDISKPKKGGGFEPCGRSDTEDGKYPKCVPASKASKMTPEEIASAVRRKRTAEATEKRQDKKPINVSTDAKDFDTPDISFKSAVPTDPELYARVKAEAKKKFDVYPSAYANAWLVRTYKKRGGGYREGKKDFDYTELYNKTDKDENSLTSFKSSQWKMFDRSFAARIKKEYPEIWAAGGNIKGNAQYAILTKIAEQGGKATTSDQMAALKLREAWVARHAQNFQLPGVIAQMKWLAVGSRGEDYMKNVVREAIDKKNQKSSEKDGIGYLMNPNGRNGEKPATMMVLMNDLESRVGSKVKIQDLSENTVIFSVMKGNEVMTLRVPFYFDGTRFMFGDPEPVRRISSWVEIEDGDEEGNEDDYRFAIRRKLDIDEDLFDEDDEQMGFAKQCGCRGSGGTNSLSFFDELVGAMKNDGSDFEVKAGRVVSAGNLGKLQQAVKLLTEIIAAGGRAEIEMKDNETVFVSAATEKLFALKSFIDPVISYHQADCDVMETGISFKSSSVGFIEALSVALKNFNHLSTKSL